MYWSPRRQLGYGAAGAHARQMPVGAHEGTFQDVLRRHEADAKAAARGTRQQREAFLAELFNRATDPRILMCAIVYLISKGEKAPGPRGLRLEQLSWQELWDLARTLSTALRSVRYRPGRSRPGRVPKTSGEGTRGIEISDAEDRVVQRAIVLVLQPYLEALFDELSFGFRPNRGRMDALAMAMWIASSRNLWYWVTEDVRDAFDQVPHGRLLDILRHHGIQGPLLDLIDRIIRQGRRRGIAQGGPLSPLLLNVYLDWLLDRIWRRQHPDIPLIRVADDLLVLCSTWKQAQQARLDLERLLVPAGMPLKGNRLTSIRDLTVGQHADWLGLRITRGAEGLVTKIGPRSWESLAIKLARTHTQPCTPLRAAEVVMGWVDQLGPTYPHEDHHEVCTRIHSMALEQSLDERPTEVELIGCWERACARWLAVRDVTATAGAIGVAGGSAPQRSDSAGFGRGSGVPGTAPLLPSLSGTLPEIVIYTDGSCLGPHGPGGWAWIRSGPQPGEQHRQSGSVLRATANRMELLAVIEALDDLPAPCGVKIVTDSEYVHLGITERLPSWRQRRWRRAGGGLLANVGMWQRLDDLLNRHHVVCEWVRGHSGDPINEACDRLAQAAAAQAVQAT